MNVIRRGFLCLPRSNAAYDPYIARMFEPALKFSCRHFWTCGAAGGLWWSTASLLL